MSIMLPPLEVPLRAAVAQYWQTLSNQSDRQRSGDADRGGRSAVTGGRQMDGFCALLRGLLVENKMPEANIYVRGKLGLPGFFRPTKEWDMLIVHQDCLVAAVEFKSQKGPSFGNNFNNRTEEALGSATDLWTAYREGAFGARCMRPWLGWVMLLEDCEASTRPVSVTEPHFKVFAEFQGTSYAQRYELLLRKMVHEKLYDGAALLLSTEAQGIEGGFNEPAADLTMKRLLAGLLGHVGAYLAGL